MVRVPPAGAPAGALAVIALGEALVEVMRPGAGQPLDRPGTFVGPLASGAPAIFAVAAARLGPMEGAPTLAAVEAIRQQHGEQRR